MCADEHRPHSGGVPLLSTMRFDSHRLHAGLGQVRRAARGPLPPAAFAALLSPWFRPAAGATMCADEHRPHPGPVQLLSTMRFNSNRLHVALGPGSPRCADPLPPPHSPPSYRRRPAHHGCSPRSIARPPQALTSSTLGPSPPHSRSHTGPWPPPGSYSLDTWPSPSISTWTLAATPPRSSSVNTGPSQPPGFYYPDTGPPGPCRPAPAPSTPQAWPSPSTGSY